jgi:hypothetical protein
VQTREYAPRSKYKAWEVTGVVTIGLGDSGYLAYALEAFLIGHLKPRENKVRPWEVPDPPDAVQPGDATDRATPDR